MKLENSRMLYFHTEPVLGNWVCDVKFSTWLWSCRGNQNCVKM